MTEVTEAVKENVGKSSYVMRGFFEDLIGKGELIAYLVEVDKQTVVTDTEEEIIVRRTKGATLTSVNELREYLGGNIVEDVKDAFVFMLEKYSRRAWYMPCIKLGAEEIIYLNSFIVVCHNCGVYH